MNALVSEVVFDSPQGGRRPKCVFVLEISRPLTEEDVEALASASQAPGQRILQIRQAHHGLAQLLAKGLPQTEVSLITGYSPSYISSLQNDPAFAELLQHYSTQRDLVFVDVMERMKTLGVSGLEELQMRLEQDPGKFANRELLELVETTIVKPAQVQGKGQGGGGGAASVAIQVKFVAAKGRDEVEILDVTPREASSG